MLNIYERGFYSFSIKEKQSNSIFVSSFITQSAFKSWIPNKNLRIEYKVANQKLTAAIYIHIINAILIC